MKRTHPTLCTLILRIIKIINYIFKISPFLFFPRRPMSTQSCAKTFPWIIKGPRALAFRLSMPISTHPIDVLLSPNSRGRALGQTPYSRSAFLRPYIRRPSLDCAPIDAPIVVNGYSLRVLIPSSRVSYLSLTPKQAAAKILAREWRNRTHVQHRIQQGYPVRMPSRCWRQRWQGSADS